MKGFSRPARRLAFALAATAILGATLAATGALGGAFGARAAAPKSPISAFASDLKAAKAAAPTPSAYLAGYQITEPGISRASVSFAVPAMTCPTSDTQGTAVGIGNEQTVGAPTLLGIVFLACVSGSPYQTIQATAGGNSSFGAVAPGDRVSILIVQTRTKVTSTVTDVTSATTVTATGTPTPDNSMTFGSFPLFSGSMLPVADFGRVGMVLPTLENSDLMAWSPTGLVRKDGSTVQITASAFNTTTGAFTLVFRHN